MEYIDQSVPVTERGDLLIFMSGINEASWGESSVGSMLIENNRYRAWLKSYSNMQTIQSTDKIKVNRSC